MDYKSFFKAVSYIVKKRYQYNEEIRKLKLVVTGVISDVKQVYNAYVGVVR